jgi:hypothetical protein
MNASASKTARRAHKPTPRKAVTAAAQRTPSRKPSAGPATTEPFLRFPLPKALQARTAAVLAALEASRDEAQHGEALADLVAELTQAGMDYYYLKALQRAEVGFVSEQSARLGLSGAAKIISSVSRKFIVRMDKAQLLIVARHIRELG